MHRCSVLLARSNQCGWAELRQVVEAIPSLRLVGQSSSSMRTLELAAELRPDIVISDSRLGQSPTLPLLAEIRSQLPACHLVIVAPGCEGGELPKLAALDLTGYLLWKDLNAKALHHVLAVMPSNDIVFASREVAVAFSGGRRPGAAEAAKAMGLSEREYQVLWRLGQGFTEKQIAREDSLGLRSVERAVNDLKIKLNVPTSSMLGAKAIKLGLVQ